MVIQALYLGGYALQKNIARLPKVKLAGDLKAIKIIYLTQCSIFWKQPFSRPPKPVTRKKPNIGSLLQFPSLFRREN